MAAAVDHALVDVLGRGESALQRAHRAEQVRNEQQVHDEPRVVLGRDRDLPQRLGERPRALEGLLAGRHRLHDFDQLHDRHGIEEVEPDRAIGPGGGGGHLDDRQRRGVGREDRVRRTELVELHEHRVLDFDVLDDGLDHDVAIGEVAELGRAAHARERRLAVRRGHLLLLDRFLHESADLLERPLPVRLLHLACNDLVARLRADVDDPAPHEARPENTHLLDLLLAHSPSLRREWTRSARRAMDFRIRLVTTLWPPLPITAAR